MLRLRIILILSCLISFTNLIANGPCSAISVPSDGVIFNTYDLTGQTASGIDTPECGMYIDADLWLSFTAPAGGQAVIEIISQTIVDPAMAFYSGSCSAVEEFSCVDDQQCGEVQDPGTTLTDLIPGNQYFIRVWSEVGIPGTFKLRILDPSVNYFNNQFNAFNLSNNCVQLTTAAPGQHGCSWYHVPYNFNDPIELEFELNFGSSDAGADGICFVLSTSPDVCGEQGGGIGALGIPNSVIVEFDTYFNGPPLQDIPDDHIAINLNGDFYNTFEGPVSVGNIEDGQPHDATITWDPVTMTLNIYFDGALVLSTSGYDYINNVFGGSSTLYWGWTGSTGAAFNNQSFCFDYAVDNSSAMNETVEVSICPGESYTSPGGNQYDESGVYSEDFIAPNGCASVRTIELTVLPQPDKMIEATICSYQVFSHGGQVFDQTGIYSYDVAGQPCDTNVTLDLSVIEFFIDFTVSNDITCDNSLATITANLTDISGVAIDYSQFQYDWTTDIGQIVSGQGSSSILVSQAGAYFLTIYVTGNAVSCTYTTPPVLVNEDTSQPTAQIIQADTLNCDLTTTILDGSGSFPAPLLYEWMSTDGNILSEPSESSVTIEGAGTYQLIITNLDNGCKDTINQVVTLESFSATAQLYEIGTLDCQSSQMSLSANISGGTDLNYSWSTSNGHIQSDSNQIMINIDQPGDYHFTFYNDDGCSKTTVITVAADTLLPNIEVSDSLTLNCQDQSGTLTGQVVSPIDNFIFLWTHDQSSYTNSMDTSIQINEPGIYYFEVTDTLNHCKMIDSIIVSLNENIPDFDDFVTDVITCKQSEILLDPELTNDNGHFTYSWSTQNGTILTDPSLLNVSVGSNGLYILLVTDTISLCSNVLNINATGSSDLPIASAPADLVLDCLSPTTQLLGTYTSTHPLSDLQLIWTTTNGNISGNPEQAEITITTAGTYYFTVTNQINNCSTTDSVVVSQNTDKPLIDIESIPEINCLIGEVDLTPEWINAGINPTIVWTTTNGNIVSSPNDSIITVDEAGDYIITVTNSSNGCLSSFSIQVSENLKEPSGDLISGGNLTCEIRETQITFEPGFTESASYVWSTTNGNILTQLDSTHVTVNAVGNYQVLVTFEENGCSALFDIQVDQSAEIPIPDAGIASDLTCAVTQLSLVGSVNNVTNYTIEWFTSDGNILSGVNSLNPLINEPGLYFIKITNTDNQCEAIDSLLINDLATEPEFINPTILEANCQDENGQISFESVQDGTGPFSFTINGIPAGNDLEFNNLNAGHYIIEGIDANGCKFSFDGDIAGQEDISFILPDTLECELGQSYHINPEFLFDTTDMSWLPWSGADYISCPMCLFTEIQPTHDALLTLTVTDASGCEATEDVFILVRQPDINIFVPNAFSPGDHNGINDQVTIYTDDSVIPIIAQFKIFDRWGSLVFENHNFKPNDERQGWNGYYRNQLCDPAVFVYYARLTTVFGKDLLIKGNITLIR